MKIIRIDDYDDLMDAEDESFLPKQGKKGPRKAKFVQTSSKKSEGHRDGVRKQNRQFSRALRRGELEHFEG